MSHWHTIIIYHFLPNREISEILGYLWLFMDLSCFWLSGQHIHITWWQICRCKWTLDLGNVAIPDMNLQGSPATGQITVRSHVVKCFLSVLLCYCNPNFNGHASLLGWATDKNKVKDESPYWYMAWFHHQEPGLLNNLPNYFLTSPEGLETSHPNSTIRTDPEHSGSLWSVTHIASNCS